ncbi:MAG: AraC family transcriptional regulator [Fuerstiella sp.]
MSYQEPNSLPDFVSRQVTEARYFFLNLKPNRKSKLEVVCGGVERMRPDYLVQRNDFPYYAIEFVTEGEGVLTIAGKEHALSAGAVFAYGRGAPHTIRNVSSSGMRKYYIDFVGTRVPKLLTEAGLLRGRRNYEVVIVGGQHELSDLFDMLIREGLEGGADTADVCETLTHLMMLKIKQRRLAANTTLPRAYTTYERIRRYIEENSLDLHTAHDIAVACSVTPAYLSRLFGRFSDDGAYQYLIRRKMNFAAGLLVNEGLLVKEVAFRMGFPDAFQFSRAFKRVYGVAPSRLAGANS